MRKEQPPRPSATVACALLRPLRLDLHHRRHGHCDLGQLGAQPPWLSWSAAPFWQPDRKYPKTIVNFERKQVVTARNRHHHGNNWKVALARGRCRASNSHDSRREMRTAVRLPVMFGLVGDKYFFKVSSGRSKLPSGGEERRKGRGSEGRAGSHHHGTSRQ